MSCSRENEMSLVEMSPVEVMIQILNLRKDMMTLNSSLHEFRDHVSAEDFKDIYEEDMVDGSVTNIGASKNFRIPKMYQAEALFGRLQCLAIARDLFPAEEIKVIETKLGRSLDKHDTIYVKKPRNGSCQGLVVVRLVKATDVGSPKL